MGALDGYNVLDLSILVQGPQAAATLHDMGASVIKIELPGMGDLARVIPVSPDDPRNPYYEACNRGKRSVTWSPLDLRTPGGKTAVERFVAETDVLIHNFVPGTMEAWGLSYEHLSAINPRLVYATGSSFGPVGDKAGREGADSTGQSEGGLMFATRIDGGPPVMNGAVIADHVGCQNMVTGILAALLHRQTTGRGQRVDVSLVGGMIYAQASEMTYTLLTGRNPERVDSGHAFVPTLLHTVEAADGWIHLLSGTGPGWPIFAELLDRPDLAGDERFLALMLSSEDRAELVAIIDEVFPTRTLAEWEAVLTGAGVRYGLVRDYEAIVADEAMYDNGYLRRVEHPDGDRVVIGTPIRMSETPLEPGAVAPELGQHTEEVLLEHGYTWDDITALRDEGVFG
ncbi:CaiB/BaiF CoA transferase family protein [Candidatus Poriferisodalis sp.]|uniref:CaiB/BaiF CoA transferase family protein n=1 Tax=Candidatus Poriferisodalis sp. TaxID=3101277 RepID=UPI003B0290CC